MKAARRGMYDGDTLQHTATHCNTLQHRSGTHARAGDGMTEEEVVRIGSTLCRVRTSVAN